MQRGPRQTAFYGNLHARPIQWNVNGAAAKTSAPFVVLIKTYLFRILFNCDFCKKTQCGTRIRLVAAALSFRANISILISHFDEEGFVCKWGRIIEWNRTDGHGRNVLIEIFTFVCGRCTTSDPSQDSY